MKDLLYVYLNFDPNNPNEMADVSERLIRMDELLKDHGWEYTGLRNAYRPISGTDGDETCHDAADAVRNAEWLKQYSPYFGIGTWTNACDISEIVIEGRRSLSKQKLQKYTEYHEKTGLYAHGIIVDEKNVLMDGFTTWLLAKDGGRRPEVMVVRRGQVFKKVVSGKHVIKTDSGFQETGNRSYSWYYNRWEPVVPGDILSVRTKQGLRYMRVDRIWYVAGAHDCGVYKTVRRHTGLQYDETQNHNYDK